MPHNKNDYVSENGEKMFDVYAKPEKLNNIEFSPGMVKQLNMGKEIPVTVLASDQTSFTGPIEPTFTKNAGKFSEDKGLNYNGPYEKEVK